MVPFLVAALLLPACSTGGGPLVNADAELFGVYSDQRIISDHPHHVLAGHVILVEQQGERIGALVVNQRRDGVHRLGYSAAHADGTELIWRARRGLGCTHGHCRDNRVGMILMSVQAVERLSRTGLSATLSGRSGTIRIHAPAALFADALARWDW